MCDFFSYIIWNGRAHYLLPAVIKSHNFQVRAKADNVSPDDYLGHGTIRWWHWMVGGESKEIYTHTDPAAFPDDVVAAVKNGEYRGLAIMPAMLVETACTIFWEAKRKVYWNTQCKYDQELNTAFWDLFAVPENRIPAWR